MLALLRVTDKWNDPVVWNQRFAIFFELNLSHALKIVPRFVKTARYKFHEMNFWNRMIQKYSLSVVLQDKR